MKSLVLIVLLVNSLLSFDYKLHPKEVSKDIYCFFGLAQVMDKRNNGNMSNSCFVNMGSSYLVIDSGPTFQYATQAYAQMQKIKNLPVSYVVNSHVHDDHWLGNGFYKKQGAQIIGPSNFKDLPKAKITRMQRRISVEAFKGTEQVYPTIFVDNNKTLQINGEKVLIESVNHKAHTAHDLFVYIPSKKVVFAGDLVFNARLPSLRDGNINGWLTALQELRKMNVKYIIGGHGEVTDKRSIDFTYNYLSKLKRSLVKLIDDGVSIGDAVNRVTMKEYKNIPFYDSIHRQNVETAYRTLEWEDE